MNEKTQGETHEKMLELDFGAFELQIDKEIDDLFVPAGGPAKPEEQPVKAVLEETLPISGAPKPSPSQDLEIAFTPEAEKALSNTGLGIDVDAFELQIEKEIDSLFIPAGYTPPAGPEAFDKSPKAPTGATGMHGTVPSNGSGALTIDNPMFVGPDGETMSPGPGRAGNGATAESSMAYATEASRAASPRAAEQQALASLVEALNVAYLSFDWEFSSENVARLGTALDKLEPYCSTKRETHTLFKISRALLQHVKTRPDAVHPQSLELVREAQELLKSLLLNGEGPGAQEKDRLRNLTGRFQALRDQLIAEKTARGAPKVEERPVIIPESRNVSPPPPAPEPGPSSEAWTLKGLQEWMASERLLDRETAQKLEEESKRLQQIEDVLGRNAALAPVTTRLSRIRSNLGQHVMALRERTEEWNKRLEWLREFESHLKSRSSDPCDVAPPVSCEPVTAHPQNEVQHPSGKPAAEPLKRRRDQVFVFTLSGRKFAVLASQLLKSEPITVKKADKLLSRGVATLKDFKPLFKSVKAGLFGVWSGLPAEILKSYQFTPLPHDVLPGSVEPSPAGGALLVSSGRSHGIIFTDSAALDLQNEADILLGGCEDEGVLGTIETHVEAPISVLNLDRVVEKAQANHHDTGSK